MNRFSDNFLVLTAEESSNIFPSLSYVTGFAIFKPEHIKVEKMVSLTIQHIKD